MKKVRWAIVGLGKIAHKVAQDIQRVEQSELYAVASRDLTKAHFFGHQYGAEICVEGYEELLEIEGIDIVYIATPHVLHIPLSKIFIENGIPVLCEKPLGIHYNEVKELIALARNKNVFLMEGVWTRFFPSFKKCLSLVESGVLGEIIAIKADFGFLSKDTKEDRIFNKQLGGGALLDVGIYPLFLALLVKGEPETIRAKSIFADTGVDSSTSMVLSYDNCVADLFCSVVQETGVEAELIGEIGRLKLHSRFHHSAKITWQKYGEEEQELNFPYKGNGYTYEIEEVNYCLLNNKKESALMTLEISQRLSQLVDGVMKASGINY
jgi:predicted dehydrogenase